VYYRFWQIVSLGPCNLGYFFYNSTEIRMVYRWSLSSFKRDSIIGALLSSFFQKENLIGRPIRNRKLLNTGERKRDQPNVPDPGFVLGV
jgi:hypothetical protein